MDSQWDLVHGLFTLVGTVLSLQKLGSLPIRRRHLPVLNFGGYGCRQALYNGGISAGDRGSLQPMV